MLIWGPDPMPIDTQQSLVQATTVGVGAGSSVAQPTLAQANFVGAAASGLAVGC